MSLIRILVVMGVSGVGKTTIGSGLAAALGWDFKDADALHSPANRARMAAGHPLTDADRTSWLAALAAWVRATRAAGSGSVLAASLLRRAYRRQVIADDALVRLIYLHAPPVLLRDRMEQRQDHFMPASLLASQLALLEEPDAAEPALRVEAAGPPGQTLAAVLAALHGLKLVEQKTM